MIKALFFDIDGTLVSFRTHKIPASTVEALRVAKERGVMIFISTGRSRVIINNLDDIKSLIDGYITMNGAYCFVGEEVIYKQPIPTGDIRRLADYCTRLQVPCIVVGERDICSIHKDALVDEIFHDHLKVSTPIPDTPVEEAIPDDKEIYQMTPFITEAEESGIVDDLPHCEVGRWHPAFADITAKGVTKQQGIDEIVRYFGLRLHETMAFGDGGNDISMLRHAGIGVAMGNANDKVKASADYVTASVDEEGVAKALKHFGVI